MINFTVGPAQSADCVKKIGAEDCPYFRNQEFSDVMFESERLMLKFTNAPAGSRVVFLTTSGAGGMEAAVMNVLSSNDRAIVINGGSFGHRFEELLTLHDIPHEEIKLDMGHQLKEDDLKTIVQPSTSNLQPISAYDIFLKLKDEYGIWICPNGGDLKDKIFRVGHIGNLSVNDNDKLIAALKEVMK